MRSIMLSALVAAALAMSAGLPGRAHAQIVISPTVSGSPYVYSSYYSPAYNYNYAWTNPYYNTYQSYWGSPYTGNYNWTWVTPNYYPGLRYRTGNGWGTWRARYWGLY
jgi:hypothetical protein